jgi:hypothetical protein
MNATANARPNRLRRRSTRAKDGSGLLPIGEKLEKSTHGFEIALPYI